MKKFTLFSTLTFCILLLAGCVGNPDKEANSSKKPSVKEYVTETGNRQFSNDAAMSIDALREEIGKNKTQFGMAYIGYFDGAVTA